MRVCLALTVASRHIANDNGEGCETNHCSSSRGFSRFRLISLAAKILINESELRGPEFVPQRALRQGARGNGMNEEEERSGAKGEKERWVAAPLRGEGDGTKTRCGGCQLIG